MGIEKDMSRAIRRADNARLKKNRKSYWCANIRGNGPLNDRQIGIALRTPAPCSCYMCGNPRKWFKETTLHEKSDAEIQQI